MDHKLTSSTETDTFLSIRQRNVNSGGALISVISEHSATAPTLAILASGSNASTGKGTSVVGLIDFAIQEHDGAGNLEDVNSNGNIFSIRARVGGTLSTRWLLDAEGDVVQQGSLTIASTAISTNPDTGSIVTVGGVGIGETLHVGGSIDLGSDSFTSGSYRQDTIRILGLAASTNSTLVSGVTGPKGVFNAFTLTVVEKATNGGSPAVQQDLYWVTTSGNNVTVTALATDAAGTSGLTYTVTKSGTDLVFNHTLSARTVDVVAAISGFRTVTP